MNTEEQATRERGGPGVRLWRILFQPGPETGPVDPIPCRVPDLHGAEIAAVYQDQRQAGDFYEFVRAGRSRLVFALLDMAGRRADTRDSLRWAQKTLRETVARHFSADDINETIAMMELCQAINQSILGGGIRACPGFLGCYNEDLGTVCYANAGHTPALVRDETGITRLEATGLPLGLFSHALQGASTYALPPGGALLVVSRGIVEAEFHGEEFSLQGATASLEQSDGLNAHELCVAVLRAAERFTKGPLRHNDVTALALVRE